MARDLAAINAFTATSLYRKRVRDVVEASGFRVEDVTMGNASHKKDWGFVLSLSDDLKAAAACPARRDAHRANARHRARRIHLTNDAGWSATFTFTVPALQPS